MGNKQSLNHRKEKKGEKFTPAGSKPVDSRTRFVLPFLVVVDERSSLFLARFLLPLPSYWLSVQYQYTPPQNFADHVCWASHHGDLPPGVSQ